MSKVWQESSWLQALEGGIDSSHAPILHRALTNTGNGIAPTSAFVRGSAPTLEVDVTDYGYRYTGVRALGEDEQYVRGYHFIMPFTQLRPGQNVGRGTERPVVSGHHWVPIDDYNCMVWNWHYAYETYEFSDKERSMEDSGNGPSHVNKQNEYRATGNRRNGWLVDRDRQRSENFTGIDGINAQDRAVQESMGEIVDRSREHLGPADRAIIAARRLLSEAVKAKQAGTKPRGAGLSYTNIRASEKVFSKDIPWRDVLLPEMYPEGEKGTRNSVHQLVGAILRHARPRTLGEPLQRGIRGASPSSIPMKASLWGQARYMGTPAGRDWPIPPGDFDRDAGLASYALAGDLVRRFTHRVGVMEKGKLVEQGLTADVFARPRHPYTIKLINSRPRREVRPSTAAAPILVAAHDVNVDFASAKGWFGKEVFHAVRNATLALKRGETLGIVGESGSGKTTLGMALLALQPIAAGEVTLEGTRLDDASRTTLRAMRRRMQVVFRGSVWGR